MPPIGVVDEDIGTVAPDRRRAAARPTSSRLSRSAPTQIDPAMNSGRFIFVLEIPPKFEHDVLAGRRPTVQINVDATAMTQAGNGAGYLQNIIAQEALSYRRTPRRSDGAADQSRRSRAVQSEPADPSGSTRSWRSSTTSRCW